MFVSNIDNTGAVLDLKIAQFACDEGVDYIMECTKKTENDIKGGTLIDIAGQLMHLEIPQVPPEHLDEFCSTRTFKIFNTNNIWVNLRSVKEHLHRISSEIIVNKKLLNGRGVLQLETSIGGCIRVHVGRNRFLPVKKTDDLLLVSSNLYSLSDERSLVLNRNRPPPTVELGEFFQYVDDFRSRFEDYPEMLELDSLKIKGDVRFEKGVVLKGDVQILNESGKQRTIISGTCINNDQIIFK
ncbi:UTP--glucose-1-phosphate uridylyltransferase [Necator americanus]|uniref:UTP--glucose-1-phosphate uridylyltransferase n=1 Tax=Necator americanus TaxID=51031 RepID=W2TE29_NECAM|nr:UTP--glucose-1-phosphate uridylyltransferase [Necator americanus]ETN79839.1 UTP--glucose-1-phosphate uridylyltransferase [Necator americanus]